MKKKHVMEKRFSKIYPQKWLQIPLLLGFCLLLYFLNLGQWDLWSPDEPRYAQVAREMVNGGDWILMHYNGETYTDKPPLFFWLIALSSFLWQGFNSFSVRFPSALFATLTVLLTFLFGKKLYSSRTGFLSGFILATSFGFIYLSTRANIDTTLTFFTTASLFCFFQWYQSSKGEENEKGMKGFFIYGFYIFMAIGTLTKGPVGFILPLLVSFIYLLVQKDWKGIKGMKLLPGMFVFIVIVLSWYLPAVLRGGKDYLHATLFHHTAARFAKGTSHVRPIYYYLYNFPSDFLPWVLFLPGAIAYGYSREMMQKRKDFFFLLIWFVVIFVFFSLSKGKRGLYLLPLFPAVSLMTGKFWDDFITSRIDQFRHSWLSFPLYGLSVLIFLSGIAIPWVTSMKFPSYLAYSLPVAFLMIGGSFTLFALHRFKHQGAVFFLLIGILVGVGFYTLRVIFPLVNPYKSARFISQEITSRIQPGERLAIYGGFVTGPYNYYTEIVPILELEGKEALFEFLKSSERVFCLLKFRDFSRFQNLEGRPEVQLIARRRVGDDDIVLISNR